MGYCRKRQINHREYRQLRFRFQHEENTLECFATAPNFMIPAKYLVTIQLVGVVDDVMLEPEDVDPSVLELAVSEAYATWILETSF